MCTAELGGGGEGKGGGGAVKDNQRCLCGKSWVPPSFQAWNKKKKLVDFFTPPPVKTIAVSVEPCGQSVRAATWGGDRKRSEVTQALTTAGKSKVLRM